MQEIETVKFFFLELTALFDLAVTTAREHFLAYVPLQETTGAFMVETILEEFKKIELCLDNLRGQSYNMKAKHNGAQKKIIKKERKKNRVGYCLCHALHTH